MTDEEHPLRGIDWAECFPFVHLFRAFRLAANARVLALLLLAVFFTCAAGTLLDKVWPAAHRPYEREAALYPAAPEPSGIGTERTGVYAEFSNTLQYYGARAVAAALHGRLLSTPPDDAALLPARTHPLSDQGLGLLDCAIRIVRAKLWLVTRHPVFAILFAFVTLVIWSVFGGAACRMLALHAARDERITISEALAFSRQKLLSFFTAPLIPYALILVVGVFLFAGGVVGAIPWVGELFAGLLFLLALVGGFIIAVVLIGAAAGSCLMWPTISVEGSDAFDAISRSFSYVFARPWHTALYAGMSLIYGGICYLFVRLVIWLLLLATHLFVGAGMTLCGSVNQGDNGLGKLDLMWQTPTFVALAPTPSGYHMTGTETTGAALIFLWVWVAVGLLYTFVASFFFSGTTLIYYLLRRDVDATDLEEVYVEEEEEEDTGIRPAPAAQVDPPAADTPGSTTPPEETTNDSSDESTKSDDDSEESTSQ